MTKTINSNLTRIKMIATNDRRSASIRKTIHMVTLLAGCGAAAVSIAADEPKSPALSLPAVPDGFVVEVVASPPLVAYPTMACFDEVGRLFVADGGGVDMKRPDLERELPGVIRVLEDTDNDGRFDKSTLFADKLTFPQGVLWHDGAIYTAAPPFIWRLEDTDGDGVADRRDKLVGRFGFSGNGASIHGCFLGPAGRIYWCDGRHGYKLIDPQGQVIDRGKAARIFSCKLDGSDVRVHCGGGMDNPVEIDFTPEGEMLGTVNLMYRQRGDCLVHWMHGGVYPKFNLEKYTDEFPQTGDLLREVHNFGHVAVSGMTRYRSGGFGDDYRDNWFVAHFNSHRLVRVQLDRSGSTFQTQRVEPFLTSKNGDFHPTDVLEDADGSLLLVDTGGWFLLGCPTSQIANADIQGAIYRIRRQGVTAPDDPWGKTIDWPSRTAQQLALLLGDDRFIVRRRAIQQLVALGEKAVPTLSVLVLNDTNTNNGKARRAVWALARMDSRSARQNLRLALHHPSESVRNAAAYACGVHRDRAAVQPLTRMLPSDAPPVRRQAATALGQIGDAAAVPALLDALRGDVDRVLEHALIYALIEIADPQQTAHGLTHTSPQVQRGALIALDQMPGHSLTREQVFPLLHSEDFALRQTALNVVAKHPAWAEDVQAVLGDLLTQRLDENGRSMLSGAIIAFGNNRKIQQRVADALISGKTDVAVKRLVLESIGRVGLTPLPKSWSQAIAQCLADSDDSVVRQAVATLGAEGGKSLLKPLFSLARDASRPADLRVQAMAALPPDAPLEDALLDLLIDQLENGEPMQRLTAARAIGKAKLAQPQLYRVAKLVAQVGPLELAPVLASLDGQSDAKLGMLLVHSLQSSPGRSSVAGNQIRSLLQAYPADVQQAGATLIRQLQPNSQAQAKRLAELEKRLADGNADRGRQVFLSRRTSCSACHRIGNEGGRVGPDLTQVGQRRSGRDLAEAVLFPSASIARGFESMTIITDSGKAYTGIIVRESGDAIHLRTADQQELRILREEIEEMAPSSISIMPQGLDRTMSKEELLDLLAYLQTLR